MFTSATISKGIPLPYSPQQDDGITVLLLGCFVLSAYILSHSHRFLLQLVKDFFLHRERTNIFAISTGPDIRYLLLLIVQTCVLASLCLFKYFMDLRPELSQQVSPHLLLGIYIGSSLLFLIVKWLSYSLIGWIFFNETKTGMWLESYSTLLYYLGFILFPFALFLIYFNLNLKATVTVGLFLLISIKLLIFYKELKLFCNHLYGGILLILYFCALEIVPCFILYRGMLQLNEYLIIKI